MYFFPFIPESHENKATPIFTVLINLDEHSIAAVASFLVSVVDKSKEMSIFCCFASFGVVFWKGESLNQNYCENLKVFWQTLTNLILQPLRLYRFVCPLTVVYICIHCIACIHACYLPSIVRGASDSHGYKTQSCLAEETNIK